MCGCEWVCVWRECECICVYVFMCNGYLGEGMSQSPTVGVIRPDIALT